MIGPQAALIVAVGCAAMLCAGCSWFPKLTSSSKAKKKEAPAALAPVVNRIQLQRVWTAKLSGEYPKLRLGLGIAADGERVFAANHKGEVEALDLKTGKVLWRTKIKAPLAGGPAAGYGVVLVGSSKGDVITLAEADGKPGWRTRINAEILSPAAIGSDLAVIRAVDGHLHALSLKDGSELWVAEEQVPKLSLRGTSAPLLAGDLAINGFDNGRVAAIARVSGSTAWDTAVGQSHGSTELQRLIDIDAPVVVDGDDLFAVAYQGRVARLALETGQVVWARDLSSYRGLAVDDNSVYISTADGDLVRVDRKNGTEQWDQKALERRQLTAPVIYRGRLVVADGGGVLHWLDPATGDFLARAEEGQSASRKPVTSKGIKLKRRISSPPIVAGGLLLVFTDSGVLSAYRAPEPPPDASAVPAPSAAPAQPAAPDVAPPSLPKP
jgi:outer membrane protein assembly factor BamB